MKFITKGITHLFNYRMNGVLSDFKSDNLTDELQSWLRWAREKIDWYDPLIEKDDDIFSDIDRDELKLPLNLFGKVFNFLLDILFHQELICPENHLRQVLKFSSWVDKMICLFQNSSK